MDILGGDLTTFPPKEVGDNDAEDRTNGGDCEGSGNNHDVERGNESNDGNLGSDSDKDDGERGSLNVRGGKRGGYPMSVNVQRQLAMAVYALEDSTSEEEEEDKDPAKKSKHGEGNVATRKRRVS